MSDEAPVDASPDPPQPREASQGPAPHEPSPAEIVLAGCKRLMASTGARWVLWVLVAQLYVPAFFTAPVVLSNNIDEHYFTMHEDAARKTIVDYGELPVWNPWDCGGVPGIANPQDTTVAPDFLLRVVFGTESGRRMAAIFFILMALEGMFLLARQRECSWLGAVFAAVVFATSGRFSQFMAAGWLNFLPFAFLPWLVYAYQRGLREPGWRLWGGFFLCWMMLCGGTYTFAYAVAMLGFLAGVTAVQTAFRTTAQPTRYRDIVSNVGTMGVSAMALGALRVLPMAAIVFGLPREWTKPTTNTGFAIAHDMFNAVSGNRANDHWSYFTTIALGLFVLAWLARDRRMVVPVLGTALFFGLAMGDHGTYSPSSLLSNLPVYGQLRAPQRFTIIAVMFMALGAGRGLTVLQSAPTRLAELWRRGRDMVDGALSRRARAGLMVAGVVVAGAVAWEGASQNVDHNQIWEGRFHRFEAARPYDRDFRQGRGNRWAGDHFPRTNLGVLACYEETPYPQSTLLRADLPAEEYPVDPRSMRVERIKWSPHAITLNVEAKRDGRLLVNQNWHAAWESDVGAVVDNDGLLGVDVPAGKHTLTLRFSDTASNVGLWISLATLAWMLWLLGRHLWRQWNQARTIWRRKNRRQTVARWAPAAAGALLAVGVTLTALSPLMAAEGPEPMPPDDGTTRFGLTLKKRKLIFKEFARGEAGRIAAGKRKFKDDDWSVQDHRGNLELGTVKHLARKHLVAISQVFMVVEEGIHKRWPAPNGKPLFAGSIPLKPRTK